MDEKRDSFYKKDLGVWLDQQPIETSFMVAARSAFRIIPIFSKIFDSDLNHPERLILPLLHAAATPWAATKYPVWRDQISRSAANATQAASVAAKTSYHAGVNVAAYCAANAAASVNMAVYSRTAARNAALEVHAADSALRDDLAYLLRSVDRPDQMLEKPLWPDNEIPDDLYKNWEELKSHLLSLGQNWDVWTDWYEDRLLGRPVKNVALEVARVTLPEPIWREGPALVNSTIRELTDLAAKGGDEAVKARMAELQREYSDRDASQSPDADNKIERIKKLREKNADADALKEGKVQVPDLDDNRDQEAAQTAPQEMPSVWLLQFKPDDRVASQVAQATAGSTLAWKAGANMPKTMQVGDPVVYWRGIDDADKNDRGGLVGIGKVISTEISNDNGIWRFPTEVQMINRGGPFERDTVLKEAGISRPVWRNSVNRLTPDQIKGFDAVLRNRNWIGIIQSETTTLGQSGEGVVRSEEHPNTWLVQYDPDVWSPTEEYDQGSSLWWKTRKALPKKLRPDDVVIYWRMRASGGVVGTGTVVSSDLSPKDDDGWMGFPTEVREFDESKLIARKEAIEAAGIDRKQWQGAVLELPADQAQRLNDYLIGKGWQGFLPEAEPDPIEEIAAAATLDDAADQRVQGEINMRRDDAERDHDALGRAPLAISLAWALHEIWCNEQGVGEQSAHQPDEEAPGFVAHVDAPWGGGKTSFANLIARTLNPNLDEAVPEFLKKRYPDRKDMSGLFLAAAHEKGGLVEDDRAKYDREARRPWIIVPYNAWLNQHVDPPWWSFYQTIRRACFQTIRKEGCPEVIQKGDGSYENRYESRINRLDRWRGLWVRELWWRISTPKVVVQLSVTLVSVLIGYLLYQLGLVADLKGKAAIATTSGIGLVLALITGAGSFIGAAITVLADALAPGRNSLGERVALGSTDPLKRFRTHFAKMMQAVERPVLVIIDDIDRCEPKFIVEMTRGLQTILKSPRVVYLLLGDRNWIEQAFEVCHEDMNSIDVGAEHTFGGRFVEKAIQLSFILPGITGKKEDYVREVLSGRAPPRAKSQTEPDKSAEPVSLNVRSFNADELYLGGLSAPEAGSAQGNQPTAAEKHDDQEPVEISASELLRVRQEMSQAKTAEEISAVGAAQSQTGGGDKAYKRAVREEAVLRRAAQREEVEEAIRHWLQPLAKYLPGNPRHIKRIINAVFMYQNSLLLTEEDYDEADFGGEQWRQLVIGVVLMVGYPNSWSILTRHPDWVEPLSAGMRALPTEGTVNTDALTDYQKLRRNSNFVNLLSKTELRNADREIQTTLITEDTVRWLNELIPLNGR